MTFEKAVKEIQNDNIKCDTGLKALGKDSKSIKVAETMELNGSINLDKSLESTYPNENRWDYSFGYRNKAYFVEIHPAYTSEVDTMLKKLKWLKNWLSEEGKPLGDIKADKNAFNWIYTSKCDIIKNTKQYRAAAQNGILPLRELKLD